MSTRTKSMSRTLTMDERTILERFLKALEASQERDPKYAVVLDCLTKKGWLEKGCIIFSQFYDSIHWLADQLVQDLPGERIGECASRGQYRRALEMLAHVIKDPLPLKSRSNRRLDLKLCAS
jgi:hypothetical protein